MLKSPSDIYVKFGGPHSILKSPSEVPASATSHKKGKGKSAAKVTFKEEDTKPHKPIKKKTEPAKPTVPVKYSFSCSFVHLNAYI